MTQGANLAIWIIAAAAAAGVLIRPFRLPEAIWAVAGVALLILFGLLPLGAVGSAVLRGDDVYLFLSGMMLLAELGRCEGLFDWAAARAVRWSDGSPKRLFLLIYAVGALVTVFLSNDATAVVLTPAVYRAARRAGVSPLPCLFACAFIANAASFVLPISNPANLVLYAGHLPPLGSWLTRFGPASSAAVLATFIVLRWRFDGQLRADSERQPDAAPTPLSQTGRATLACLLFTVTVLLAASALGRPLGAPTAAMGLLAMIIVTLMERKSPWAMLRRISWSTLLLVAGLFVIVEALGRTGLTASLAALLSAAARTSPIAAAWQAGALIALLGNLANNLPVGLEAAAMIGTAHPPSLITDALLIGVDLGPNLSITGSLATILWLIAVRREGEDIGFWRFLKLGALVMPPALLLALAARLAFG